MLKIEHAEDHCFSQIFSMLTPSRSTASASSGSLIQIVGSARPIFIDKFINITTTHSQGKLRAIFALSFPTMSYIYKFIDRALHQPTQKYSSSYGMVPSPSCNAIGSTSADERMTPRPNLASSCARRGPMDLLMEELEVG